MGVAKVLIIDEQDQYLLLWRGNHPRLPNDPDLPGGTIEAGEVPDEAALREVDEEAGITLDPTDIELVYTGTDYSAHGIEYSLYVTKQSPRPEVAISWEHESYEWLTRDNFLKTARDAKDTYMHMVYDVVSKNNF
ncbi:MAG: hydrolase [Candidatus Saccharibacteria bacterium]|nr:hydrolase [Candidatus Saccharibacteria bacterium]